MLLHPEEFTETGADTGIVVRGAVIGLQEVFNFNLIPSYIN
jgi:hypothetical protein